MIVGEMSPEDVTAAYIKLAQYQEDDSASSSFWKIVYICVFAFLLGLLFKRFRKS
jgi:hypothetical protein